MATKLSDSAIKLRKIIDNAIEDHEITRKEYELIINQASKDGHIDSHEQALLVQLQQLIEDNIVKLVP